MDMTTIRRGGRRFAALSGEAKVGLVTTEVK